MSARRRATRRALLPLVALLVLGGCATADLDRQLSRVRQDTAAFGTADLALTRTSDQQAAAQRLSTDLLQRPLASVQDAVRLALAHSPALQAALAQGAADAAAAAQSGRIANPLFTFERVRLGDELEFGRLLSFGLLDLLTLPQRQGVARQRQLEAQLRLSAEVVDQLTQVRQAWVQAVAAQQLLGAAQLVQQSAGASAELARRMQAAGNFNKLDRARQQAFHAEATTQLALAQHQATASREALVRALGLTEDEAEQLRLPARLPELPTQALSAEVVTQSARQARLDVRLAAAALDSAASAQGLGRLTSLTDVELGIRRDTVQDPSGRASRRGGEISLRLPLFDAGDAQRAQYSAQTLAAAQRLEATTRAASSQLREAYSAYRTAHDIALHQRDEVMPLRQAISDETVLRYNGMLIGVFELLADSRERINSVSATIAAQQQFWLADAALQASLIGRPTAAALSASARSGAAPDAGH
jgi:outer membrane protein TolC